MANGSVPRRSSSSASAPVSAAAKAGPDGSPPAEARRPGAADLIRGDVVDGLYDGRYLPGQRLVEAQLTATYGTSRGPVREALNALAHMGVVELAPGCGARIRAMSVAQAIDVLHVAQALIGTAARLAAGRIGQPGAPAVLERALAALAGFEPGSPGAGFATARDGFYAALTRIAGSAELRRILPTVQIHVIRVQFRAALRTTDRSRHADYRAIADAVLGARPAAAEAAVRRHFDRAVASLERLLDAPGRA